MRSPPAAVPRKDDRCTCWYGDPSIRRRSEDNRRIEKDESKEGRDKQVGGAMGRLVKHDRTTESRNIGEPQNGEQVIHPQAFASSNLGDPCGFSGGVL